MGIIAKIKALWAARKLVKEATKEAKQMDGTLKPGILSTEFWTKNIVQIIIVFNTIFKKDIDPQIGISLVVALEAVYGAGRTIIKLIKEWKGTVAKNTTQS